jgi:hypothetical protein
VLRNISGLKRDEILGGRRKLHNEELRNLYSSLNILRMIKARRVRACNIHGGKEKCIKDSGGNDRKKETIKKTKTQLGV